MLYILVRDCGFMRVPPINIFSEHYLKFMDVGFCTQKQLSVSVQERVTSRAKNKMVKLVDKYR